MIGRKVADAVWLVRAAQGRRFGSASRTIVPRVLKRVVLWQRLVLGRSGLLVDEIGDRGLGGLGEGFHELG